MLTPERHRIILELLQEKELVKIQELVEATLSSESTIRRDLSQLEESKKLKRVHGGASLIKQKGEEPSIVEKTTQHTDEKDKIARLAASFIRDRDCIYLDAGTTTLNMIRYINAKEIKVVTNGLPHLQELLECHIDAYVVGGYLKKRTGAFIGRGAIEGMKRYHFDKAFIGVNGIHSVMGYTTPDPEEAILKKTAIELSQDAYVLADHSKFHEVTFANIASLKDAIIITDLMDEDIAGDIIDKTNIEVVTS